MLTLYHYGDSLCSMKTRFCLFEKGVTFESHFIDLLKWEHLTEDYKAINPILMNMGAEFNKSHFPHIRSGVVDSCEGYYFPECPSW